MDTELKNVPASGTTRTEVSDESGISDDLAKGSVATTKRVAGDRPGGDPSSTKKRKAKRRIKGGARHNKKWRERRGQAQKSKPKRLTQQRIERGGASPANTTQFLIDEHYKNKDIDTPKFSNSPYEDDISIEVMDSNSSDSYSFTGEDSLIRDFDEEFENDYLEKLTKMTKENLLVECIDLQKRVELLEKDSSKGRLLEDQMRSLQQDNRKLIQENFELRHKLHLCQS